MAKGNFGVEIIYRKFVFSLVRSTQQKQLTSTLTISVVAMNIFFLMCFVKAVRTCRNRLALIVILLFFSFYFYSHQNFHG